MYLLDTNIISELRRPERASSQVRAWAQRMPAGQFYLSVITILEIEQGTLLIARRDPGQASHLRRWIDEQILPQFEGRILPIDVAVAQRCAKLHVPDPRAERDALIAATALVHGMTIVTRNGADFAASGADLINPWDAAG